jgi:hypothetical protein
MERHLKKGIIMGTCLNWGFISSYPQILWQYLTIVAVISAPNHPGICILTILTVLCPHSVVEQLVALQFYRICGEWFNHGKFELDGNLYFQFLKYPVWIADSAVGIVTGSDQGVGKRVPVGSRIFFSPRCPYRFSGPPSLVSKEYRGLFPRG